ncbi:hypothetical protein LAZ67_1007539, partial [Cordylochernes scorpioides]
MVKEKEDNVSLDRLKPVYLLKESYPEDDDRGQQPGIQQDLQPSKARTQRVHFEETQRTRSAAPNTEYKRCSSCIPGLGALTRYYQPGQLSPGFFSELVTAPPPPFSSWLGTGKGGVFFLS